jgi:hypothetical protein
MHGAPLSDPVPLDSSGARRADPAAATDADRQFETLIASHRTRAFGRLPPSPLIRPVYPWAD